VLYSNSKLKSQYIYIPSVTLVDCIETAEDIIKLLSQPYWPLILFFEPESQYSIPRGTHSEMAQNTWGEKMRFSTEIAVYLRSETV